jgi:GMP synthase-like glutamine amidotransferase
VTPAFPDPAGYDVIVPMGAPWSVYDEESIGTWITDELRTLGSAVDADVPVFGICFGGQALAAALGGAVRPAERAEIGWTRVRTARPDLVEEGPWFEWHADRWVLPAGAQAVAWTDVTEQAFVAGRSMGVQFHPELTPTMLHGWLANGGAAHARRHGLDPDRMESETAGQAAAAARRASRLVDAFLQFAGLPVVEAPRGSR